MDKNEEISEKYKLSPIPILEIDNIVTTDPHCVVEALAQHFASVGSNMSRSEEFEKHKNGEENREIRLEYGVRDHYYEEIRMRKLISCLNAAKYISQGRDDTVYKMIRYANKFFKNIPLMFYNRVYAKYNIPSI